MTPFTQVPNAAATCASIQFIGYSASVKMDRNSTVMMPPSTSQPHSGCTTTWSMRSEAAGPVPAARGTTSAQSRVMAS